ncbi:type II secretion system protein [Bacillus sp. BGMRC 2118]|nr:type II secretion system protein [Bacillus sp. BGMRC 2118]
MPRFVKLDSKGFTLLEILASLSILGIVLITLLAFFTQAYSYTNLNKNKTVAVNIARNTVTYIEKQNFYSMKQFMDEEIGTQDFVEMNGDLCEKDISITKNGTQYDRPLFDSSESCTSVLVPEINNTVFNTEDHYVEVKLRQTPKLASGNEDPLSAYLLHFDVEVHYGSSAPITIQGVISNETN